MGGFPAKLKAFAKRVVHFLTAHFGKFMPIKPKTVLFECFLGQSYGDQPKYIYEEMLRRKMDKEYTLIWAFRKNKMDLTVPGNCKKVAYLSLRYLWTVMRCETIVNNSRFPYFLVTNPKSVFLQTWHGTPLKRLGLDQDEVHMPNTTTEKYKANIVRSSAQWDYMLSQNRFSSERFCSAFALKAEKIWELGYPRNDILSLPQVQKDQIVSRVKQTLGIAKNKRVVMYAPTFRDNDTKQAKYNHTFPFDLNDFAASLGEDTVLLLRLHYLVSQTVGKELQAKNIVDASAYPDITELYLAANMLITDYSSVMFDYAITGKPMLFFMYDLAAYRDVLRGFYFDLSELPGPMTEQYEEMVTLCKDPASFQHEYAKKYLKFREKFNYLDDGKASARTVDKLFSRHDQALS